MRSWHNHYEQARDVHLDDILDLVSRYNNHPRPAERKARLREWLSQHDRLDAYILPSPSGWHNLGARYGNEPHEYVSFTVDKDPDLDALLKKAPRGVNPCIKEES